MAATRIVAGTLREIWQEAAGQPGGAPQVITTRIRIATQALSRIRALLVVDGVVGAAVPGAAASVVGGVLVMTVSNPVGATSFTWTLDVELTHSVQQGQDFLHGAYIAVVNGFGVGGVASTQNLSQTYNFGAAAVDQRMVIDTAKGGGVVVEASTAAVTGDGGSFEIRQNAAFAVPFVIRRAGDIVGGPNAQFARSRGTIALPTAVQSGDELATIDYYGHPVAAYTLDARIVTKCVSAAPTYGTGFEFYLTPRAGALGLALRLNGDGPGSNTTLTLYNSPDVESGANHTGRLGESGVQWGSAHVDTVNAYDNLCIGGATIGGGALHTVLLPNTATMPVPQANQVYIGAEDFGAGIGSNLATFSISAEEPSIATTPTNPSRLIPIIYNGSRWYLLAVGAA